MGITADIRQKIYEQFMDKSFTSDDFNDIQEQYGISKANITRNIARLIEKGDIVKVGYQERRGRPFALYKVEEGADFAPKQPKPYKAPKIRSKESTEFIPKTDKQQQAIMRLWESMNMPKISDVVNRFSGFPIRTYQAIF